MKKSARHPARDNATLVHLSSAKLQAIHAGTAEEPIVQLEPPPPTIKR